MSFLSQIIICITFKHFDKVHSGYISCFSVIDYHCTLPLVFWLLLIKTILFYFFCNRIDLNPFLTDCRLLLIKDLEVKGPIFNTVRRERNWVIQFMIATEFSWYEWGLFWTRILCSFHYQSHILRITAVFCSWTQSCSFHISKPTWGRPIQTTDSSFNLVHVLCWPSIYT